MKPKLSHPTVLLGLICAMAPVGGALQAAGISSAAYRTIEPLLLRHDADGNGTLDPAEREKLRAEVRRRHRAGGLAVLDAALRRADSDRDGRVTRAEWQALGRNLRETGRKGAAAAGRTHMVPMSDGVRLATDVYLPPGQGPWPVLLMRTPYGRGRGRPTAWLAKGYAVVCQDMRGRFDSEGENLPFIACGWGEHRDGLETVAWIRRQPWCSGKVGTLGGSALGITQNLLAGAGPEGLACQHITVAAFSLYHHAAYVGGALRKSQVEGWLRGNRFDPKAGRLFAEHPAYDEWWQQFDGRRKVGVMTAPAMHVGGWFDTFSQGTIDAFVARQHRGGAPGKGRQKLVIGPWGHGIRRDGRIGELRFPNAGPPAKYDMAAWFAHWLKGENNGVEALPAVAYYVMGDVKDAAAPGNEWRFAPDWPIPAEPTAYYFYRDGSLSTEPPRPASGEGYVEYTFDPARPCPTVGGCNLVLPKGPMDQRRVEKRPDVLTFTTAPLREPTEVTGNVVAELYVSSSEVDTDISVRFCDVYPDGRSYLMAEGMLRLRCREGFEKPVPLTPGKVVKVPIRCWATSVVVNRGHRIRVAVTSSNSPRFDVNPGTGRPHVPNGPTVRQVNRLWLGGARPSRVVLPVVRPVAGKKAA